MMLSSSDSSELSSELSSTCLGCATGDTGSAKASIVDDVTDNSCAESGSADGIILSLFDGFP